MTEIEKLNIRPTTSVYATYQRLRYDHSSAIAEFVDNSTQSYFTHRDELKALDDFERLFVQIIYRQDAEVLEIHDNAYGMDEVDFKRAIRLDSKPIDKSGRNEFGMGLKTAACWYGKLWSVESTRLGSTKLYRAVVDVEKLARDGDETIDLFVEETNPESHYTSIIIEKLHNKIGHRSIGKLKRLLASTYRVDLRSGDIDLYYNEDVLSFKEPSIYSELLEDGTNKEWKKEISFEVEHEGNHLPVHGFVAIRETGNLREAGFALLRRDRVIVGGDDRGYRPREISGDPNSFTYQRLFGELHMDDWPVTQAKDDFNWYNSGLEEQFIEELVKYTKDYRAKAESIRVRSKKTSIPTKTIFDTVANDLRSSGSIEVERSKEIPMKNIPISSTSSMTKATPQESGIVLEGSGEGTVVFSINGKKYSFNIQYIQEEKRPWFTVKKHSETDDNVLKRDLTLNMGHKFFESLAGNANDSSYFSAMTRLVMAMIIAEDEAISTYPDRKIDPTDIRLKMNDILNTMTFGNEVDTNDA